MSSEACFDDLMERLRAGDQEAARAIFHRFGRRLVGLARSRLNERMRQKVDPEDVMQSVLKSFFRREAAEPFELRDWDMLWSLLTVMTLRKCGFRTRHYLAQCRDVRREAVKAAPSDESDSSFAAIAREPSPDEAAALNEVVADMLRPLDARDRSIVELALQGTSPAAISSELSCSERTVYRLLARIRSRLERQGDSEAEARS
jgi:RNA polymerase sigma-70 factor, ECF subfamily